MNDEKKEMYYIQNVKENRHAPFISWWKIGDHGYTSNIQEAKQFTKEQIDSMYSIQQGDKRAWPVYYICSFGQLYISEEELDIEFAYKKN